MTNETRTPADYVIGDDATIEDANLDEREIYYQGERLTEARVLELDEQIAAGIERRQANLIPGAKSLSGDGKHSPTLQVRISEHTRDRLREIAADRHVSVSKLSSQVLDEFVAANHD